MKIDKLEVGRYLKLIRERARLSQSEIAQKVPASPARISRIESGEIMLTQDEIGSILDAIGTEDADQLRLFMGQEWEELDPPPFDHPNRGVLWLANELLGNLRRLKADPELKGVFIRHIEIYEQELRSLAANLRSTKHTVSFVGSIGVGKSLSVCSVADLRVSNEGPLNKQMVLEVGAGGTTICEVHLKKGPGFGLIVEPRSETAIKFDVADFAEYLLRLNQSGSPTMDSGPGEVLGVSKEINRAIRNLAKLIESKTKDPSGSRTLRRDPARELAIKYPEAKELMVQILSQMDLPRRDGRDIWYQPECKVSPLVWLQETFMDINNGRHSQFSLPQRIEVVIPRPLFDSDNLDIEIDDTKGIDGAATRADLDRLFDDPRALIVLCSRFNDAPENSLQQLLSRVKESGAREIIQKTLVLVLPRPDEALAVKDDTGIQVESDTDGYDLKRTDVEMHLSRFGLQALQVEFFNAKQDDPAPLRKILVKRLYKIRAVWEDRIKELAQTVEELIANNKQEQTAIVYREVTTRLNTWISKNREIPDLGVQTQQELIKAIEQAHWRSIWASIRRRGVWYSLDYYYQLGFGARTAAAKCIQVKASQFEIIIQNLLDDADLTAAHSILHQVKHVLRSKTDDLLKRMEIVGKEAFADELSGDRNFWAGLEQQGGSGYRDTIAVSSDQWFKVAPHAEKQEVVASKIIEGWAEILMELDTLLNQDPKGSQNGN